MKPMKQAEMPLSQKCLFLDQSTRRKTCSSVVVFLLFVAVVPTLHFVVSCSECDHNCTPYDAVAEVSLSCVAVLSFVYISRFLKKFGPDRFVLPETIDDSRWVRLEFKRTRSLTLLVSFTLPLFVFEFANMVWRYSRAGSLHIKHFSVNKEMAFVIELLSWCYRSFIYSLFCVMFQLNCHLQLLRLEDFTSLLLDHNSIPGLLLVGYRRIVDQLDDISRMYRGFIVLALGLVTVAQSATLIVILRRGAEITVFHIGYSVICSFTLLFGPIVVLGSASRLTNKAQSLAVLLAKWHASTTVHQVNLEGVLDENSANSAGKTAQTSEKSADKAAQISIRTTLPFLSREALVNYVGKHTIGIDLYGFVADRNLLNTIFVLELTLVLWILGLTIKLTAS